MGDIGGVGDVVVDAEIATTIIAPGKLEPGALILEDRFGFEDGLSKGVD